MITYTEDDFKASVGKHGRDGRPCYNTVRDQEIVQYLLNRIPADYGGADGKLNSPLLWGRASAPLQLAIEHFQKVHAIDEGLYTDGHIDPHDRTIRALLKYAYHRLYQWADDTPPPPTHREILPTSGIKITNTWEWDITAEFSGTSVHLSNGVDLPLPPRGRVWPKRGTRMTVSRSIDKDGSIQYNVYLRAHDARTDPVVRTAEKTATDYVTGKGPDIAAEGLLRAAPKLTRTSGSAVLGVLIPSDIGGEKSWQLHTTEGSARCTVNGLTNF